tara:strand:- start:999 stop:1181 length:183 start_codon:yes stop_codon:yes gene_type:complete
MYIQQQKGSKMQYTLITKTGKVMQFYIKSVADTYQLNLGGVVFTQQILDTTAVVNNPVDQ